jgi:hypothetical protein
VAEFLSDEWIAEMDVAARASPFADGGDGGDTIVVEPLVHGVPRRGDVRYRVTCDTVVRSVTRGDDGAAPADVGIDTDYATACALARGDLNGQTALADGSLRVSGDLARLAGHAGALARLADLFESVRACTTYPAGDPGTGGRS